jgi:hypothetical protein
MGRTVKNISAKNYRRNKRIVGRRGLTLGLDPGSKGEIDFGEVYFPNREECY